MPRGFVPVTIFSYEGTSGVAGENDPNGAGFFISGAVYLAYYALQGLMV